MTLTGTSSGRSRRPARVDHAIEQHAQATNKPLTTPVNGLRQERETGFEPATSSLGSCAGVVLSENPQALTATPPAACTSACTSKAENANALRPETDQDEALAALAAAIAGLSPADRERLGALLAGQQSE